MQRYNILRKHESYWLLKYYNFTVFQGPFLRPHVAVAYVIDNQRVHEMPPFASQKAAFQRLVDGLSEGKRPSIGKRDYKIPYQRYNKIKYS